MTTKTLGPRRQQVLELWLQGVGATEIGRRLGMSRQRVYQHLRALRNRGYLPEEAS